MQNEINIYELLTNISILLIVSLLIVGLYVKVIFILLKLLSYPIYLALYSLEFFIKVPNDLKKKHFFRLNLPSQNSTKRLWMDSIASFIVVFITFNIGIIYSQISLPKTEMHFIESLSQGNLIQMLFALIIPLCIFIIYIISYFTPVDLNDRSNKIQSLTIPSLLIKITN